MYECMYVCVCVYVCMYVSMYLCIYACMHAWMDVCMYEMYACMHDTHIRTIRNVCITKRTHRNVTQCNVMCVCMVRTYVRMYVCM